MTTAIYWFRNDLRLIDSPAFNKACKGADLLLPIYIHQGSLEQETAWGFPRMGMHRKAFLQESLQDLRVQLRSMGSDLIELSGEPLEVFQNLYTLLDTKRIYCEQIQAPDELDQIKLLSNAGFEIQPLWQSSMLDPQAFPFALEDMPDIFTQFRQQVEKQKLRFCNPVEIPTSVPSLPSGSKALDQESYL